MWRALGAVGFAATMVAAVAPGATAQLAGQDQPGADSASAERPAVLPNGTRVVRGRVVTPSLGSDTTLRPVPGVWVTLHRVARDAAGPLDSTRTGADGRFAFTFRPRGDASVLYFVSTSYGGVAYFTPPLRQAVVSGDAAEITVFDTTSAAIPITVRGQHVVVSAPATDGTHEVLEVYDLSNDGQRTGVPGPGHGVWSAPLPRGATQFGVRESADVPPDGMAAVRGRAVLLTPFAPGLKQVAYAYRIGARALPLAVTTDRPVSVFEVLLEDPRGTVTGAGLTQVAPVSIEGRTFHRFLAQNVPANAAVTIDTAPDPSRVWPRWAVSALVAAVGGALVFGLLAAQRRRRAVRVGAAPRPGTDPTPEQLLGELAALDDAYAARTGAGRAPSTDEAATYAEARAALKRQLAERLATSGRAS